MTIRPPVEQDYDRMAALAGQLGYESTAEDVRARLAAMRDGSQYAVYVAELPDGRLAGWIGVYVFRTVETDWCAEISGLVVDQDLRSRGVGQALLGAAEQWARGLGSDVIFVRSNVIRTRAHRFYAKNGFAMVKTQACLSKRL